MNEWRRGEQAKQEKDVHKRCYAVGVKQATHNTTTTYLFVKKGIFTTLFSSRLMIIMSLLHSKGYFTAAPCVSSKIMALEFFGVFLSL